MKIIHDGTKVSNDTICGFDERKYPRYNKHGKPLPGHGYYVLEGDELKKAKADTEKEPVKAETTKKQDIEKQWAEVHKKRDELLKAIVVDDNAPKKKKEAIEKYRDALKNIEKDFKNPADVIWPDVPEK